jgi:hypothetical protein
MQVEITPIFLILAAVIGLLVGLLVASLFSSRESKSDETNQPPQDLVKDGFAQAASLMYSPSGKKIVTHIDGGYYRDYSVLTVDQKTRVNKLLALWTAWAGRTPEVEESTSVDAINGATDETADLPPIEPVLDWSVAEALKSEKEEDLAVIPMEDKPKTIAGQISLIIERMMVDSPIKEKGIKLIENSRQGVDVWIGLEKFDGIDAIPYPDVQQLIRDAVAQWEREMEAEK